MSGRLEDAVAKAVKSIRMKPPTIGQGRMSNDPSTGRIARLRDRHHTIARMVAAGMPDERVCFIMGMTLSSLLLLKDQTPAFQELVHHYEQQPDRKVEVEEYLDQKARLARLAQLELQDRLIEEPEKVSFSELLRLQADYDDRTGFSKQSVNVNVNLDLAARLEHNRRQRQLATAGAVDGGGALSGIPVPRSAPPLLDLKAEAPAASTPPGPADLPSPPAPPKPVMHDTIMAGRSRYIPEIKGKMRRI